MKCPFCQMGTVVARRGRVQFACGMVMATDCLQQAKLDEIEDGRLYQPTACIRAERDRYIRHLRKLRAAGNALARHVALRQDARALVQAWEEAAR